MRLLLVLALFFVGCQKEYSGFCEGLDGCPPKPCEISEGECVCLTPPGVCVECTPEDERNCANTRPQCGEDNRCRACSKNDDCNDSEACLEDGACADASRVIYTTPNGVNTASCGRAKDGTNACSLPQALLEIDSSRDVIRLGTGSYVVPNSSLDGLDFNNKTATLIARGATLTRMGNGAFMTARNNGTLKLVGGTLRGPNNDDGLKCSTGGRLLVHEVTIEGMSQSGIETDSCEFTVSRSTIRNNLQGGINMINTARAATITNNFVYRNGTNGTPHGGMVLRLTSGSKVEFNTVVDNDADLSSGSSGGITCEGQGYDAPFNLVYRNEGGIGGQVQVIGTCTFLGSYAQGAPAGENAVGFENPTGGTPSYRLTAASPPTTIRDAFECNDIDFERDIRPSPPRTMEGKCDFGADEYRMGQ